jgi:hypothetical protein
MASATISPYEDDKLRQISGRLASVQFNLNLLRHSASNSDLYIADHLEHVRMMLRDSYLMARSLARDRVRKHVLHIGRPFRKPIDKESEARRIETMVNLARRAAR